MGTVWFKNIFPLYLSMFMGPYIMASMQRFIVSIPTKVFYPVMLCGLDTLHIQVSTRMASVSKVGKERL